MPDLDHRRMSPPFLREVHVLAAEPYIGIWDLRLAPPNVAALPSTAVHSLEHFLNDMLRDDAGPVLLVAPMGCRTGFYMLTNDPSFEGNANRLESAFAAVCEAQEVPLANVEQCGWAEHHSLVSAQNVARYALDRRAAWSDAQWPSEERV